MYIIPFKCDVDNIVSGIFYSIMDDSTGQLYNFSTYTYNIVTGTNNLNMNHFRSSNTFVSGFSSQVYIDLPSTNSEGIIIFLHHGNINQYNQNNINFVQPAYDFLQLWNPTITVSNHTDFVQEEKYVHIDDNDLSKKYLKQLYQRPGMFIRY